MGDEDELLDLDDETEETPVLSHESAVNSAGQSSQDGQTLKRKRGKGKEGETKDKKSNRTPWQRWWRDLRSLEIFSPIDPTDGSDQLYCVPCSRRVSHVKLSNVQAHTKTEAHKSAVDKYIKAGRPRRFLTDPHQAQPSHLPSPATGLPQCDGVAKVLHPLFSNSSSLSSCSSSSVSSRLPAADVAASPPAKAKPTLLQSMLQGSSYRQVVQDDTLAAWGSVGWALNGLEGDDMRGWLTKYCAASGEIPVSGIPSIAYSRVGLRRNEFIKNLCLNQRVAVSFDEWTDSRGKAVLAVVLHMGERKPLLVDVAFLVCKGKRLGVEHTEVATAINGTLSKLCIGPNDIMAFVSDEGSVMVAAYRRVLSKVNTACVFFCLSHKLNNIAKEVFDGPSFKDVVQLVSASCLVSSNKQASRRRRMTGYFAKKGLQPTVPPQPSDTRWVYWRDAAEWWRLHLSVFRSFLAFELGVEQASDQESSTDSSSSSSESESEPESDASPLRVSANSCTTKSCTSSSSSSCSSSSSSSSCSSSSNSSAVVPIKCTLSLPKTSKAPKAQAKPAAKALCPAAKPKPVPFVRVIYDLVSQRQKSLNLALCIISEIGQRLAEAINLTQRESWGAPFLFDVYEDLLLEWSDLLKHQVLTPSLQTAVNQWESPEGQSAAKELIFGTVKSLQDRFLALKERLATQFELLKQIRIFNPDNICGIEVKGLHDLPLLKLPSDDEFRREWGLYVRTAGTSCRNPDGLRAFWKSRQGVLPPIAEFWCCFPASTGSVERVFSAAGTVDTDLRYNLSDDHRRVLYQLRFNGVIEGRFN